MTESSGLPPEHEAVRRLLADARHDGPPPPEVVARLDDALASLVAERATAGADASPGRIVDLGSRRRRVAGIGLLAAASVVVAGVALGQAMPRGADVAGGSSAGSQSDTSLAEAPESETESEDGAGTDDGGGDSGAGAVETAPESLRSSPATPFAGLPDLSSGDSGLDDQVLALRDEASTPRQAVGSVDALRECGLPRSGRGRQLFAQVDGQPGVVVYRRPVGEAQRAEIYVCGVPDPVRTLTLPAP